MYKKFLTFIVVCFLSFVLIGGCKAVKTRVITVERVDQQVYGNAGYLYGSKPKCEKKEDSCMKTRKIYEIDITPYTDKEKKKKVEDSTV